MTSNTGTRDAVEIGTPSLTRAGKTWRVEAIVDGTPAWFESDDAELAARPEAFASAFLGPALAAGRPICVNAPLDPAWLSNVAKVLPIWQKWWGYHIDEPIRGHAGDSRPPADPAKTLTASCFTGGADSFYTLLRAPNSSKINRLLFVHGYDIPLADTTRMAAWDTDLRRVASATGRPAIVVRANLRLHPLFRTSNWERTHGGALAAAGHVVANLGRLVIPSSYTYDHDTAWGSHYLTDASWSATSLEVIHDDASLDRRKKLRALADEPLAWDALRVCWEGRTAAGNCSMCEKCVRTMTVLHLCGRLDKFGVFDRSVPLEQRLTGLKRLPPHLVYVYEALLKDGLSGAPRDAVRRLLAASRPPGRVSRLVRKVMRRVACVFG